eukprot:g4296.t1
MASTAGEGAACGVTRGNWRRSLFLGFVVHACALVMIGSALFEARGAGGSGVGGMFCMVDRGICPETDQLVDGAAPSLGGHSSCPVPEQPNHHQGESRNSTSCINTHTAQCLYENDCLGAFTLASSVLNHVELKHVDSTADDALFFAGLATFFVYILSVASWEFPLARDSYAWGSTDVPERIFLQPFLIGLSVALKASVFILLWMLIQARQNFPDSASCTDINLLPSVDDVKLHTESRTKFLAACERMTSICKVSIVGIPVPRLNNKKTVTALSHLIRLYFASLSLIVAAFFHKWCVWSTCVAQTVDDEGATAYLRSREEEEAEEFELAIRRIQERRREKREKRQRQIESRRNQSHPVLVLESRRATPAIQTASEEKANADAQVLQNQSRYVVQGGPGTEAALRAEEVSNVEEDVTSSDPEDDASCIICLDSLSQGGNVEALVCGHVFHSDCILQWFEEGGQGRLCPLCRHPSGT